MLGPPWKFAVKRGPDCRDCIRTSISGLVAVNAISALHAFHALRMAALVLPKRYWIVLAQLALLVSLFLLYSSSTLR